MKALYYAGRFLQLVGMSLLIASILADTGRGPSPRLFAVGIGVFLGGWLLVRPAR
ncbi:MAG TPA: hypothetical protein VNI83_10370 [Vicinamibacterales bacterium]|nr:hypothetical protein [Vicinamibacterales bacterium]